MTARTYTEISCDGPAECGAATHTPFPATATEVRAHRKPEGWHQRPGGRDICPGCWAAGHR